MIEQVKEVAITVEDVVTFITSSLPTDLEQRYCQVFRQYRGTLHKYVRCDRLPLLLLLNRILTPL